MGTEVLARGEAAFACDLFGRLRGRAGNLFFSPYSIAEVMAMVRDGAAGATGAEISKALHLPGDAGAGFAAMRARCEALEPEMGCELRAANRIWPKVGYELRAEFVRKTAEMYGAEIEAVDFAKADAAAKTINDWVAGQTRERIKNLVSPRMFTTLTRLVLTNAIYFKARWAMPFEESATENADFHTGDGRIVKAKLMQDTAYYAHATVPATRETPAFAAVELHYQGPVAMLVLLPAAGDLAKLEAGLSAESIAATAQRAKLAKVRVMLPKFRIEDSFSVNEELKALGVKQAFEAGQADFSGMTASPEGLWITDVVHKAFVDVNEEGTEAAAATAVIMAAGSAMPRAEQIIEFRADRPFLFVLREKSSGAILFMGRVADPTK